MTDDDRILRPHVFYILLALADRDLHGLGIAEEVETATDGGLELGPGTLYRSLKELSEDGLIEDAEAPEAGADPRRRYYRMTARGRSVLTREATRLAHVVDLARRRSVFREGGA